MINENKTNAAQGEKPQFATRKDLKGYRIAGSTDDASALSEIARDYSAQGYKIAFVKSGLRFLYFIQRPTPSAPATPSAPPSVAPIDPAKVSQVYSGINGKCCCGCSGKHSYSSAHAEAATKSHGYDISDKVSDRSVKRIVNLINENLPQATITEDCAELVIGGRLYLAYFAGSHAA